MPARRSSLRRRPARMILALTTLALVLTAAPPSAHAQFVCQQFGGGDGGANASGSAGNFACGNNANATGGGNSGNSAIGTTANASGEASANTAMGLVANASGEFSFNTATGTFTNSSGDGSRNIASGFSANASGDNSSNTAIGNGANAAGNGQSNLAIGTSAQANNNSVAVGANTTAAFTNSAAFGNGATATRENQQVFGTATNTYTMAGVTSAASRTAQGTPTHLVTSNAGGDLAAYTFSELGLASSGDLAAINSQLATMQGQIGDLYTRSNKAYSGIAMAFAMAGVPTLMPNERFAATFNYGTYLGQNGFAINTATRLSDNLQLTGGIGYGSNERTLGGRVGLRMGW